MEDLPMNSLNHNSQVSTITPANPAHIRSFMDRSGLSLVPNKELSDSHMELILKSLVVGSISIEEKNKLLAAIILSQLEIGTKYLGGIKHPQWKIHCSSCGGKGFHVIMETKIEIDPCVGNSSRNALPCNGSGIKTSLCNRCSGLKLDEILRIRNEIMIGGASDRTVSKYGHFAKIKIDTIGKKFIEENRNKTFRVVEADEEGNKNIYYYIPKSPCRTCNGTGHFIHDRKNIKCGACSGSGYDSDNKCEQCKGTGRINGDPIKCPGCDGKGNRRKQLVSTGKVKSFVTCARCEGLGTIPINPVLNLKAMPDDVKNALEKSGLLK